MPASVPSSRWLSLTISLEVFCLLWLLAVCNALADVDNAEIRLDWGDSEFGVQHWQVRDGSALDEDIWQSLIAHDSSGQRISEHLGLVVNGSPVGPEQWLAEAPESPPGKIHRRWSSLDGHWRVDQKLVSAGLPYRLVLTLELTRLGQQAAEPGSVRLSLGPGLGETPIEGLGIATSLYSFVEPVVKFDGSVERIRLADPSLNESLETEDGISWVSLNSRYFALLINPSEETVVTSMEFGLIDSVEPEVLPSRFLPWVDIDLNTSRLNQGDSIGWEFEIFSGPKSRSALTAKQPDSNYTELLFHGLWNWMRGLCNALLRVLEWLYLIVPSWGLAICLLAVLVRILLYPMARWALASQQKFAEVQRDIQPKMAHIKKKYRGGEQSERILKLYESHGVSPLAGLKPLLIVLIQIPIFVALFHVLGQAFELRHASFLWMDSLAKPDQLFGFGVDLPFFGGYFNLLPVLMALTTLATIKLSPAPASSDAERRRQNIFLALMALAFFLLFYPFPSGMVLYWTMANVLHILQAWLSGRAGKA